MSTPHADSIRVQVRCFASVRDLLAADRIACELPRGATVLHLRQRLCESAPELQALQVAYAVNQAYVRPEHVLQDGDEVALIPPISGGSGDEPRCAFSLSEAALDPREMERQARTDRDGALATFVGTTRDHNDGLAVRALCYEAYPEMVEKVMARLFAAACERFDVSRIRVAHRLGEVPIGEASVVVVVSAAHRGPAFEACRFVIDRLKEEAPIWKRELLADGNGERWVGELPKGAPSGIDQG